VLRTSKRPEPANLVHCPSCDRHEPFCYSRRHRPTPKSTLRGNPGCAVGPKTPTETTPHSLTHTLDCLSTATGTAKSCPVLEEKGLEWALGLDGTDTFSFPYHSTLPLLTMPCMSFLVLLQQEASSSRNMQYLGLV
jgi:hypothetical protein